MSPNTPPWTWPKRSDPDDAPARQAAEVSRPEPGGVPGESARSLAIRSAVITTLTAALSTAAAFGLRLSDSQSAALVGLVTTGLTLWALWRSGGGRG
jgi:hypothetical protein